MGSRSIFFLLVFVQRLGCVFFPCFLIWNLLRPFFYAQFAKILFYLILPFGLPFGFQSVTFLMPPLFPILFMFPYHLSLLVDVWSLKLCKIHLFGKSFSKCVSAFWKNIKNQDFVLFSEGELRTKYMFLLIIIGQNYKTTSFFIIFYTVLTFDLYEKL